MSLPLFLLVGCERSPSPATSAASALVSPAAAPCDPATSFVEIIDGTSTSRFTAGRMLGSRGSTRSFAELVRHPDGTTVFSLEGIEAGAGARAGHIALSVNPFEAEHAQSAPGSVRAEYMRSGAARERDELTTTDGVVSFTRFGDVGQVVEGTFGPVEVRSGAGETTTLTVRFQVCRTEDWVVTR